MVGLVSGGFGTGGARVRPPETKPTIHQTHHLMTPDKSLREKDALEKIIGTS